MNTFRTLLTALMSTSMLLAVADDEVPGLNISQQSGEDQIELSEIISIKYTDTNMIVNLKDGTSQSFSLDEIIVMELGRMVTSIKSLMTQADNKQRYSIIDPQGKLIAQGQIQDYKEITAPTRRGVYVITIGNMTHKLIVK